MNRNLCLVILSIGTVLVILGLNMVDSLGSSLSRLVAGGRTDPALWLLIAGIVLLLVGTGGVLRSSPAPWLYPKQSRARGKRRAKNPRSGRLKV